MIPAPFDYASPATLDEALSLLAAHGDEARILAGGHSLIPAMKLRLAQPTILVDIGRIGGLSYIRDDGATISIGAMTTHYEIESSAMLRQQCPLLPMCAETIGDVQVRNRGTIAGSLAHSDPAGDWPPAVLALDAEIAAVSAKGERVIPASDFFVDLLTTALAPGEIIREIRIPKRQPHTGHAYLKVRHPASGFAVVGVAAAITLGADGTCAAARIGITGVSTKAYRATAVEADLMGKTIDETTARAAAMKAADGVDVNADLYASEAYRTNLAQVYTRRAILEAAGRA